MKSRNPALPVIAFLMIATSAFGQSARTGSVAGRVFNPANDEYVRNAQIRIAGAGAGEVALSGEGGFYLLGTVPAGDITLELSGSSLF
ncbi:MAG: hypothetical protein LBC18_05440 [Opitutaceae bacterium]|jgi:hypothetical protein|nr:hypothetical protein [Opitutaceae bacterium]